MMKGARNHAVALKFTLDKTRIEPETDEARYIRNRVHDNNNRVGNQLRSRADGLQETTVQKLTGRCTSSAENYALFGARIYVANSQDARDAFISLANTPVGGDSQIPSTHNGKPTKAHLLETLDDNDSVSKYSIPLYYNVSTPDTMTNNFLSLDDACRRDPELAVSMEYFDKEDKRHQDLSGKLSRHVKDVFNEKRKGESILAKAINNNRVGKTFSVLFANVATGNGSKSSKKNDSKCIVIEEGDEQHYERLPQLIKQFSDTVGDS